MLLFLLLLYFSFLHARAFIFSVVTRSFSLPEFSFFHSARRRGAWVVLRSGLAARCLVSQLSVRSRGALLRRLGLRRCACDSKLFYGRSCTPLPTPIVSPRSRRTGALQCSQSLTLLLVGRAGWLHLQRRQNHLPAPPARTVPPRSSPSSALPAGSSHGSRERKTLFRVFDA